MAKYNYGKKYKFKALKIYSSREWMANSTKKYRRVFDQAELSYVRSEFTFFNKLFDEEEWKARVTIKAFKLEKNKREEICSLDETITVKKEDNVVFVYKSWGVDDEGGFWRKGDYICEAYIDDTLVGTQKFFIENIGKVTLTENPYFSVESIQLYEGDYDGWKQENKRYVKTFKRDETRYVWMEMRLKNKTNKDWNFEYFINYFDDAGQFKAQIDSLSYIENGKKDVVFTYNRGWGNDDPGSWKDDSYTLEVVFMDTLVALVPFGVGHEFIDGDNPIYKSRLELAQQKPTSTPQTNQQDNTTSVETEQTLEHVLKELNGLIGLQKIKTQIQDHINYLEFLKLRQTKGLHDNEKISLHSVFTGNPGTGKTTVVKLLGQIYQKMGLLSQGHVHEVDRADLVGEYIGQTAPKVKEAIKEARGGILFIDEAYMLARSKDDPKDFGKEVVEVILKEMSDGEGNLAIMVAGYPAEMETFINSNPGLKSRFKYYFHFEDYMPDELLQIALYAAEKRSVKLTDDAQTAVKKLLVDSYRMRDRSFGNARFAYGLIDEGKMNLGLRLMKNPNVRRLSSKSLSTIELADIEKITETKQKRKLDIEIDEPLLREATNELNALIGLNKVKNEINELIKLVRYYRETGKDVLNRFSLHTVFTGNPGTGKTTVARIIGKIYRALGLLERGHVIETGREGLVAGYIGQTALKTKEKLDEAYGGILFIDEAYALSDGGENSFGKEAIEVLLKFMEDHRSDIGIIAAGYPDNMQHFLLSNPGLKSRFDRTILFEDYSPETLYDIGLAMLSKENLSPDSETEAFLQNLLNEKYLKRDKYFGNARDVRKLVEEAVKNQHLRMASLQPSKRTKEVMETLILQDVQEFGKNEGQQGRKIGFK